MSALADFRRQYPQYSDMSDTELADAIYRKYYSDLPKTDVYKRLGVEEKQVDAAPTLVAEEDDDSFITRALKRGVPLYKQNLATLLEDAPEAVAELFTTGSSSLPRVGQQLIQGLGKLASKSETYKNLTGETVQGLREDAAQRLEEIGPRKYAGFFEEEGAGRKLGSLAETVAESALPVGAGLATGLVTRSPAAAGTVMGIGNVPMTYGSIRDRQRAEGIDDVQSAVYGTIASSALDVLTGVGGKVLDAAAAAAARQLLEGGLKAAAQRVGKSGLEESGTEMLQNVVEQVAGGSDPTTKQAMLETLEAGLAGALGGTVFTTAGEVVTAPFRSRGETPPQADAASDPRVRAEFQRLATEAVSAIMSANPEIDQQTAVTQVEAQAEELFTRAAANVLSATEESADVGTGLDDSGGTGAGAGIASQPPPTPSNAPEFGAPVEGGLGRPVPSVPVSDAGTAVGERPLVKPTAAQVKATVPVIEQAFANSAIDFEENYGVKKLNAEQKKQAARIVIQSPEVDPYDAITSIIERGQRIRGEQPTPSTTGLQEAGSGMAGAMGENLRSMLLTKVEAGETMEGGKPSPILQAAKVIKDAGVPVDVAMLSNIQQAIDDARQTNNFQAAMRAFVADTIQRAAPEAKTVAPEPAPVNVGTVVPAVETVTPPTPALRTVNDMAGVGTVNPENTNEVLVEGGGVQLAPVADDVVQVSSIRAVEKGGGRKAMQQLVAAADQNGTTLQLTPEPFAAEAGKEMSPTELTEWYRGFGFQEQPDGSMVRPAASVAPAVTPTATITTAPKPEFTPQEIAENLDMFASSEARDRGFDDGMFREGAVDVQRGREFLTDQQILEKSGPDMLAAYKAGIQWAQERIADAQAAETASEKALKATIKSKPGKTVAEKVLNMAQAEMDAMPKEDLAEQVTPYDPEYETIRANPGIDAARMAKMLGPQLYGDPTNMGQVCIKEVFQNAFDATREAINKGQIEQGNIEISVSRDGRTLTVKDNGVGMAPDLLSGKFLKIAGTGKEGDKNAGGFGIAKMLFLYANKNVRVSTARDGRISELDVTGEQLFEGLDNPDARPFVNIREFEPADQTSFPDGHGTIIQLTIPEVVGEYEIRSLPSWVDEISSLTLSPLFSNINVTFLNQNYAYSPDVVEIGAKFPVQDYTQFVGVQFPWGSAKVYVTREKTNQQYGENMHILSNGLWQFSTKVSQDPSDMWSKPVPYRFYVDIVPTVKPDEPGYPFNFNRQNFTDDAKRDFGKVKSYIDALYAYKSMAGGATSFGNIQYFQPDGKLGPVIDLTPDIPVQDTAFTRIGEGDEIRVGSDGSLLVNGQVMPELTPDELKSGIPSADELRINKALIDSNAVMVHDNTDVVIRSTGERIPIPEFMRREFGERFDDFMRFNGETFLTLRNEVARVMGYYDLVEEGIGVSMDPEYRGVSIRLPFSGSFINPLVPKYPDGLRAGYGIFGTMIHELAHHKVRSHNANFPAEMQDILLNMEADASFAYQQFKDDFASTIAAEYADIVEFGVEIFNGKNSDIRVEYRGNRFTDGSREQTPEGTGDVGTGDVRGPSGAGSTGQSVLSPSYEGRGDTGERGQRAAGDEGGTEPVTNANVDKVVSVKLTKAQLRRIEEAAGLRRMKLSSMQKRIVRSRSAGETMSLTGKLMLMARNRDADVGLLTSLFNSIPPTVLQKLLGPLATEDVVRLGERAGLRAIKRIDNIMRNEYLPYVNRIMQRVATLTEKWADFTSRSEEGAQALADVMFIANMYDVDPVLAPSAGEYIKQDGAIAELTAKQAAEKDPKKKAALRAQITKRQGEIRRVYNGGQDTDGTKVLGWKDVPPAGKQLFRAVRDEYRASFDEHYRLLMQRIDESGFDNDKAVELKTAVEQMFAKARERTIYFPLRRFGEYWVSVGKGKTGEFHMFESASEQDAFLARLRSEKEERTVSSGYGRSTLRNMVGSGDASAALKTIMDLLDSGDVSDIDLLKDHVFQMYLTALPESDMRRRFIHRQFKTGFSTDVLRTFATTSVAAANQLGRLAFNYKLDNAIGEAYAETEENPSKRRLDTITREMEFRVRGMLSPDPENSLDWWLSLGAKATFLFLLSSPKSAIMNLTQLHIVGLPTLSAEFGEKATYGMAARYTGQLLTGRRIANPLKDAEGNVTLQIPNFTAENSPYIQKLQETDPDRYAAIMKAWQYAQEHDVTQSTFAAATDVYERGNKPTETYGFVQSVRRGELVTAAQRATANTMNAMGALFHNMERIGREVAFMSAFELAYDRNLKQGMAPEAAGDDAMVQAANLTNAAMFDFSSWNKSRYAKSQAGRLPLQMRSYSFAMTSLLFRSFVNMLPLMNKEGKMAAARVFFGVGAMTALYGGFRASQFYALAMLGYGLYEFVKSLPGDDEEDEEIAQGYLTSETIDRELLKFADEKGNELSKKDMEFYIRAVWIPETFGSGGTMATALGIQDAAADKLARAADIGLPGVFGVDISNSVSLGDLWHPVTTKADDPEVRFFETLGRIAMGPSGSLVTAPIKAVKEANAGNLDKAIEVSLPAIIRNYVKAERLQEEGLVVGKNRDVVLKEPDFYDTYTAAMQSLGFPEAETSQAMQLDIQAGDIEKGIAEERTKLLDRRYRAMRTYVENQTEENERELAKVERDIDIYNLNYPSNAISAKTKKKSFKEKTTEADERMYGMGLNKKIPVRAPLSEERAEQFMRGE